VQESNQGDAEVAGKPHRQAAGRRDCAYNWRACHDRLLQQLKTRPSTQQHGVILQRQTVAQYGLAIELVHGIVPPNVLAQSTQFSLRIEQRRGVQAACIFEHVLPRIAAQADPAVFQCLLSSGLTAAAAAPSALLD
jgi:hypothetical protein